MASPVLQSFAIVESGFDTSHVVSKPSGVVDGDLIIFFMASDQNPTFTPPSGLTDITGKVNRFTFCSCQMWQKSASSEPANYTFTTSDDQDVIIGAFRITGHNATPVDVQASDDSDSESDVEPAICPAVTTTVADTLILRAFCCDTHQITTEDTGYPSSHTGVYNRESVNAGGGITSGFAHTDQAGIGSSGVANWSLDANTKWVAATVAIAPSSSQIAGLIILHN